MASTDQKAQSAKDTRAILDAAVSGKPSGKGLTDAGVGDIVRLVNVNEPFKGVVATVTRLSNSDVQGGAIHIRLNDAKNEAGVVVPQRIAGHNHFAARATMLAIVKRAPKKETPAAKETASA